MLFNIDWELTNISNEIYRCNNCVCVNEMNRIVVIYTKPILNMKNIAFE